MKDHLSPLKRALVSIESLQARVAELEARPREPIAVLGIGCRMPGGVESPADFSRMLSDGTDASCPEPPQHRPGWIVEEGDELPPAYYLQSDPGGFDAEFFGISPREATTIDPQHRLALECAWEALENAGIAPTGLKRSSTGVFFGITGSDYQQIQYRAGNRRSLINAHFASGVGLSMVSGRLAYLLGLQGPAVSFDTACSSSLVALHYACESLRARETDLALAGGVNLMLSPDVTVAFRESRMLSPGGRCRAFDARADGFARGEGCGVVVLKRLAHAVRDRDPIWAVIRASALNQDGPSSGLTAPNGPQQEAVLQEALRRADLASVDVGYVEAHGTGTELGDPIEVQALGAVYGEDRSPDAPLVIGTVKTNVGHLEAAAGMAGFIKAVLAVESGKIPPNLHFRTPNPLIPWDRLPVRVASEPAPFPIGPDGRRRAGISSFGFSGTNAHVLVEQAPQPAAAPGESPVAPRTYQVLPLAGQNQAALRQMSIGFANALEHEGIGLTDLCHTAAVGRAHLRERLAVVCGTPEDAASTLAACGRDHETPPRNVRKGRTPVDPPRPVFLFTGQGAQWEGMGRSLYREEPVFRNVLDRCDAVLRETFGLELLDAMFAGGGNLHSPLDRTGLAQPALYSLEVALAELWRSWGVTPRMVIGHSVGEYAAATVAGAMSLEDGLQLIGIRARLMESLPDGGMMAAVAAGVETVGRFLPENMARASIAAINGPESVVVSGDADEIERIVSSLQGEGVECTPLRVSHAFHSHRIDPILPELERAAGRITLARSRIPIISNVTGRPLEEEALLDPGYWVRHAREPVQFFPGLQYAWSRGHRVFLECGPHPTLCGMGARALPDGDGTWVPSMRRGKDDAEGVALAVASLYAAGVDLDWMARDRGRPGRRVRIPTYPFQREATWVRVVPAGEGEATPTRRKERHPLLGYRLASPEGDWRWEIPLTRSTLPYLEDHVVGDQVLVPAAAHIEILLAAAEAGPGWSAAELVDVTIGRPLVLSDSVRAIQIRIDGTGDGGARAWIHSLGEGDEEFTLHVEAGLVDRPAETESASAEPRDAVAARCPKEVTPSDFYADLRNRGLNFGPAFQGVRAVRAGPGEALGEIALPAGLEAALDDRYRIHPVLLDAGLQIAAAAFGGEADPEGSGSELYLPLAAGRIAVRPEGGPPSTSHVRLNGGEGTHGDSLTATIRMDDADGRPVVLIEDLVLRRAAAHRTTELRGSEAVAYEIDWVPAPELVRGRDVTGNLDTGALAQAIEGSVATLEKEEDLHASDSLYADLSRLSGMYIVGALRTLGWDPEPGEVVHPEGLSNDLGILPRHRRLVRRLLVILSEDGLLREEGDGFEVLRPLPSPSSSDPGSVLNEFGADSDGLPPELALTRRCGERLAPVLTGRDDPVELVFPGGDTTVLTDLYRNTPLAGAVNGLVRTALEAVLRQMPEEGTLRVLEIGGGTGGTTAHVLPILPSERAEYTFTDIGPAFVSRARAEFGDRPRIRFETLDIDVDPLEQGFPRGGYDLVLASNVFHASRDVHASLARVRTLLAPGGLLCAVEAVQPERWHDITVGLLEGWWAFSDTELRPDYPLLDRSRWLSSLEELGFEGSVAAPGASGESVVTRQAVLLARAGGTSEDSPKPSTGGTWMVFADRGGVAESLVPLLEADGARVFRVYAGEREEPREGMLQVPETEEGIQAALEWARGDGTEGPTEVVYLWALDGGPGAPGPKATEEVESWGACALHLTKALIRSDRSPPRLHLVTRGATPVGDPGEPSAPTQAILWGLARAVRAERPELALRTIDLGVAREPEAGGLFHALTDVSREPEFALGEGESRFVPRLEPRPVPERPDRRPPRRLTFGERGLLSDLRFVSHERRSPSDGEIEIEIEAAGLNFRDVMHALGIRYVGEELGGECVGVIRSVGSGVERLRVGDRVVAAAGAFGDFVTIDAALAVPVPEGLSIAASATLPMTFLTADHALTEVGRMQEGETILVHAAAGGVGMAAVQLARAAGLRVFGTAGSEHKRAVARRLGAEDVFDSRSTSFVDDVLAATGGRGVDLVLNSLAGEFIPASLRTLGEGGRLIELGKTGIWSQEEVGRHPDLAPDISYHPVDLSPLLLNEPDRIRARLEAIIGRIEAGELQPLPHRVLPMSRADEAFREMAAGRHVGKLVLVRDEAPPVRSDGTYLVTGGLSGIGLLAAERLAARGAGRLVLLGRGAAGPEAQVTIDRLREQGTSVRVVQADVSRSEDVESIVRELEGTPSPLRGVIHSAGVLDDAMLPNQTWTAFQNVFDAKVIGTTALVRATRSAPLDFMVFFSSVSSILGSPGQTNHSAANAFLDALAIHLTGNGRPTLSVAWGAWDEVGAAARRGAVARVAHHGIRRIEPAWGMDLLERVLGSETGALVVSPMDWERFLRHSGQHDNPFYERVKSTAGPPLHWSTDGPPEPTSKIAAQVAAAPARRKLKVLRQGVERSVLRVLGLSEDRVVDGRQPLGELGLDSLLAVELRNALGGELDRTFPATLLFDYPTIDALVEYLGEDLVPDGDRPGHGSNLTDAGPTDEATGSAEPGESQALSALELIEQLSDADVGRMVRKGSKEGSDDG